MKRSKTRVAVYEATKLLLQAAVEAEIEYPDHPEFRNAIHNCRDQVSAVLYDLQKAGLRSGPEGEEGES